MKKNFLFPIYLTTAFFFSPARPMLQIQSTNQVQKSFLVQILVMSKLVERNLSTYVKAKNLYKNNFSYYTYTRLKNYSNELKEQAKRLSHAFTKDELNEIEAKAKKEFHEKPDNSKLNSYVTDDII
jgi:hypothetical protein